MRTVKVPTPCRTCGTYTQLDVELDDDNLPEYGDDLKCSCGTKFESADIEEELYILLAERG